MLHWLPGLVALFALAGCTTVAGDPEPGRLLGPPLQRFAADGRISLRQGGRSDHLRFDWQHEPERDVVLFSTPLGQGLAELGREAGGAWLRVPGQAEQRAPDLAALTLRLFGAALPLDELATWLRGARPQLAGEVDGWQVVVTASAPHRGHLLPQRIEALRDEVELKIVVTGWTDLD